MDRQDVDRRALDIAHGQIERLERRVERARAGQLTASSMPVWVGFLAFVGGVFLVLALLLLALAHAMWPPASLGRAHEAPSWESGREA